VPLCPVAPPSLPPPCRQPLCGSLLCIGVQEGLFIWVDRGFTSEVSFLRSWCLVFSASPLTKGRNTNREPVHMDADKTAIDWSRQCA